MLPVVSEELIKSIVENRDKIRPTKDVYKDLIEQQPAFMILLNSAIDDNSKLCKEFREGYLAGLLQCWYFLEQQDIIDSLP